MVQTCPEITFVSFFDVLMGLMVLRLTQICQATIIIFDENSKHNGKRLQTNFTGKQFGQSDLLFWWVIIDRSLAHPANGERGERSLSRSLWSSPAKEAGVSGMSIPSSMVS